ncbi:uncharacterized protein LOC128983489 [Macrosteles quadrilineatus]|uniref:uncharacterized protein LOC128983489 n=1 Tax=Macrosteles quadrilineatus TaxID=74068 RepID=UPI0023E1EA33|nr:uncharacterized protein LOC128983489 [Macrosteles quadrilineatus]
MKLACVSVCVLFLLVGNAHSQFFRGFVVEEPEYEVDTNNEEYPSTDYSSYDLLGNPEENEIEVEEEKPKPDSGSSDESVSPIPEDSRPVFPDFESEIPSKPSLEEKVEKLLTDLKTQQEKITNLEDINKKLILKIDSIEQQVKTNSIILTNVHQKPRETSRATLQKVLHVFNRVMKVRVSAQDISVALRALSDTPGRNKPIVVRFTNFATKMKVLSASNRLTHTNMTVSSDYSELVAQKRGELVPYLQQALAQGRRAFLWYDRIIIDGKTHTLEELLAENTSPDTTEELESMSS